MKACLLASAALLFPTVTVLPFNPSVPHSTRRPNRTEVTMADDATNDSKPDSKAGAQDDPLKTQRFESEHALGEGGRRYRAVADWITLRKIHKPVAQMFHTAYFLDPPASTPASPSPPGGDPARPLTFVFNGGPGAASAYLHMGAVGPERLVVGSEGGLPPPPVRVVGNEETWLEFTDLVFIDPIGTGFSRALDDSKPEGKDDKAPKDPKENQEYWEIERDLDSLGEFIRRFLSAHGRWTSPIVIAGESYGGYRVAKLARRLQEGHGVGLNAAILISPAIEVDSLMGSDYDLTYWLETFPAYAATALHHGRGNHGDADLAAVVREAEAFARDDLARWLTLGEALDPAERERIARRMADLIGLEAAFLLRSNGRVDCTTFCRELLRDQRRLCGRYDASVTTVDPFPDRGTYQGPDPTLAAIDRLYTGAIHHHLMSTLKVKSDLDYQLLRYDVNEKWSDAKRKHVFDKTQGAMDDLRYGMSLNEHMRVFVCHGYYDLVTPYFHSERLVGLMKLSDEQREKVLTQHYRGGHMFYAWDASRAAFRDDVRRLYADATGQAAQD